MSNQLPQHRTAQKYLKACHLLKDSDAKNCIYINSSLKAYTAQVVNLWYMHTKTWFLAVTHGAERISNLNNLANLKQNSKKI
jgi:hypothetical protein